ncbi:hypothetical protein [Flavobacterium sp.]|uniref:hypothetical protein n=1 Tax=Flavobacterium sp. TaxID=239 RepID=UPI00391A5345
MKKVCLLILVLCCISVNGQKKESFERIAFNYLLENLIDSEFKNIKKFLFNGKINSDSNGYSKCMPKTEIDTLKINDNEIRYPENSKIKKKISFFDNLISKKKKANIIVFKAYSHDDYAVVCILVRKNNFDEFLTFKINKLQMKVVEHCKTILYE